MFLVVHSQHFVVVREKYSSAKMCHLLNDLLIFASTSVCASLVSIPDLILEPENLMLFKARFSRFQG